METTWLSMDKAAAWVSALTGRKTHPQTVRGWCNSGLRGVRCRSRFVGLVKVTCAEWLEEFFEAYTAARLGHPPAQLPPTDAEVSRRQAKAEREARELGVME